AGREEGIEDPGTRGRIHAVPVVYDAQVGVQAFRGIGEALRRVQQLARGSVPLEIAIRPLVPIASTAFVSNESRIWWSSSRPARTGGRLAARCQSTSTSSPASDARTSECDQRELREVDGVGQQGPYGGVVAQPAGDLPGAACGP